MERNYGYIDNVDEVDTPQPFDVETTVEEPTTAETPTVEPNSDTQSAQEPVAPPAEPAPPATEPAPVEAAKPVEVTAADWRTALKAGVDKYEVLKELGYTDFDIEMLKYKEQTGDYVPYLQAKTVDFNKMSAEEILKLDIKRANPGMTDKAINYLYKEATTKYFLDRDDYPEGSEEAEVGAEIMAKDVEQRRKAFIEEQNKFKAPEPQPDLDATRKEAELQQRRATLGNAVMNNDVTKNLLTNKTITFGEGEESFNYPIENAQELVDKAMNTVLGSDLTELAKDFDMGAFLQTLAFGANRKAVLKEHANQIRSLEKKRLQDEMQNVTPMGSGVTVPAAENLTPAQQLARTGRYT